MIRTKTLLLAMLVVLACISVVGPAFSQIFFPYALLENEYVWMKLGIVDSAAPFPPIAQVPARFLVGTTGGDPRNPADDGGVFEYYDGTNWVIDDVGAMQYEQVYDYTDPITQVRYQFLPGGVPSGMWGTAMLRVKDLTKDVIIGDTSQGGWTYSPYLPIYPQEVRAEWQVVPGSILTKIKYNLRRDMVRQEYTLVNTDTVPHQVGMRMIWDVAAGANYYDWVTGIVPGYGTVPMETDFTGISVPEYVDYCYDPLAPDMMIRNVFKSQSGMYASDATAPDRVVVGEWGELAGTLWDYTIRPDRQVQDRAVSAWWNPITLNPGASRVIVTYYGVGVATSDMRPPYVLSVQAPRAVESNGAKISGLSPDPFTIDAYLYNYLISSDGSLVDIRDVWFNLSLPTGLELVAGETPAKRVGTVAGLEEGTVSWDVRATGDAAGELVFFVTANGGGVTSKTVRRSIVVPITEKIRFVKGLQMVSVPFDFADPNPATAFGVFDGSISLYRFDPGSNSYYTVDTLAPGEGYWMRCSSAKQVSLFGATPLAGDSTYQIPLYTGWNQVGNPYVYNIQLARLQVLYERSGLGPVSIDEASRRGWIKPTVYWYDTNTGAYASSSNKTTQLVPGKGYWIRSLAPCKLIMPPIDQLGSAIINY